MNSQYIEQKVMAIIAKKLRIGSLKVGGNTRLAEDLGVDSFGSVELMFEIEEAFGLKIEDSEIEHIRTVNDIVEYLTGWLAKVPAG
jgi:acyl carrier protein